MRQKASDKYGINPNRMPKEEAKQRTKYHKDYKERKIEGSKQPTKYLSYEAKRLMLMNDIAMQVPYKRIVEKYSELWGLEESTIVRFLECVKTDIDKGIATNDIKQLNIYRTNEMINKAIEKDNIETANKLIDTQNKTAGVYKTLIEADVDGKVDYDVNFNF